jgi:hypothetical protein
MPRQRRRRWTFVLVPLLLLAGVLAVLQSEIVARIVARALETAAEAAIGERVTIGRIEVGYLPPHVELQGLVVTHEATGDTIAAVPAIRLSPGFDGFRPVLRELAIDQPQVSLHLDADGLRELRNLPKRGGGGGPHLDAFPWRDLVIRGGAFTLTTPDATLDVIGIQAAPAAAPGTTDLRLAGLRVRAGTVDQQATDVFFPGITLAPDRLAIPALDVRFDALQLDGSVAVTQDGPIGGDLSLHLDLGRLTGNGPPQHGYVDGRLDMDASLDGTVAEPVVGGALALSSLVIWRPSAASLIATRIGDAHGDWRLAPGTPAAVEVGPLQMAWGDGALTVAARVEPETKGISGTVLAEGVSLARILQSVGVAPTPWADLRGDVETHVTGSILPFRLDGPFEINVAGFHVNDGPVDGPSTPMIAVPAGTVVGDLEITDAHLVLDGQVRAGPSHGHARADIGFATWGPLGVDVDFPTLDLSQLQPLGDAGLGGVARVNGWVGGRFDEPMTATATLEAAGAVVLGLPLADTLTATLDSPDLRRLHLGDIRARLGETDYQGDFEIAFTDPMWIDTQVYVKAGHVHDLAGVFLDLGDADGIVSGTALLSGEPYHLDGEVSVDLTDVDLYGERFPTGHATSWMDDGEFTLEELLLHRGDASVLARGSVKRGFALNMEILSDGLSVEGLDHVQPLGLSLTGEMALDAQVGGTLFEPEPRGRLAVARTYFDGERVADSSVGFHTNDGVLAWDGDLLGTALHTDGTLGLWDDQPYAIANRFTEFPLHLFYPKGQDGTAVLATLTGDLDLSGRFGDSPTPVDITGRFDTVEARWNGHTLAAPEPWVFAVHGTSMQVPRLRLLGNDGTDIGFEGYMTGRGELAFRGGGTVNLDIARAFVPELELAQGAADVEIAIERDRDGVPRAEMGLTLDGATVRSGYFPADFEALSAKVEASADGYVIRDVSAIVGGGTFRSGESVIEAKGWVPIRYRLAGTLTDSRIKYLDYLPPIVGDAALQFDGPVDDLLLSGTINIDDMEFRDRIDWEAMVLSLREERLTGSAPVEGARYFSMDLDVEADDTIRLRNNVADAEASAKLRVIGDTERPGMVGEILVNPGGRAYLHDREFEIARGEIRYVDPYTFDPDLDILLETDVRSHDQDYRVTYGVTGPFSDWRTNTSSDPYLAQADVNALLLFGVTRDELERYGGLGTALVAETGDLLLAQTAISRANLFIIDRWSLVSGVSERGSNAVTSDLRFVAEKQVGDFDVTVEKRLSGSLGSDWYASVERRIAERIYATAYVATRQEGRSLPIGAAYGAEFKFRWELD